LIGAKAELCSMYGLIRSTWTLDAERGAFNWRITIPANTTATVYVPVAEGMRVSEGGIPSADASGVRFLRREAATEVYEVTAGEYHFLAS
jgi:alpha-L-rhamnosidase